MKYLATHGIKTIINNMSKHPRSRKYENNVDAFLILKPPKFASNHVNSDLGAAIPNVRT